MVPPQPLLHGPVQFVALVVLTQLSAGHAALAGAGSVIAVVQFAGLAAGREGQKSHFSMGAEQNRGASHQLLILYTCIISAPHRAYMWTLAQAQPEEHPQPATPHILLPSAW